jgi:hypothetical protein
LTWQVNASDSLLKVTEEIVDYAEVVKRVIKIGK